MAPQWRCSEFGTVRLILAIERVAALGVWVGKSFARQKGLAKEGTVSQPPILQLIPLTSIHPSPYQYRTQFDDAKKKELIESLRATGLSTPILVRPPSTHEYELVSGEGRRRAAKDLGWATYKHIFTDNTDPNTPAQ